MQTLILKGATGGEFFVRIPGVGTSEEIPFDVSPSELELVLERIPGLNGVDIGCELPGPTRNQPCSANGNNEVRYLVEFT